MLLCDADGRGRHASVGVAIGGIAMPSSRLAAELSGRSNVIEEDAVLSSVPPAVALCSPRPSIAVSDLMKLCLKKLDKGWEARLVDENDDPEELLVGELWVSLKPPSALALDVVALAAAEVL